MTEQSTSQSSAPPAATTTPYELHIHFQGAFIFSLKTESSSSDGTAKLSGVEVYAPACGHTNAATINTGSTYMLESYWHCIDPTYDPSYSPTPLTVSQLKQNVGSNTPWTPGKRPVMGGWDVAFLLPTPPEDWQCDLIVPNAQASFSGQDSALIPASVALEQILVYKQVTKLAFDGACFNAEFPPVAGVVDLFLSSEVPFIPTLQHERRATDAMAKLMGLDIVLTTPLGSADATSGKFMARDKTGNCLMGVISGP